MFGYYQHSILSLTKPSGVLSSKGTRPFSSFEVYQKQSKIKICSTHSLRSKGVKGFFKFIYLP